MILLFLMHFIRKSAVVPIQMGQRLAGVTATDHIFQNEHPDRENAAA